DQVKGGGAVPKRGTSYTLNATSVEDFRRDVLKSDTCRMNLPDIDLVMEMGTLGSMYTTVEGLLAKVWAVSRFFFSFFLSF
ncbi:unnamed protein product, partial [Discosporangium mesarthrocarpum]